MTRKTAIQLIFSALVMHRARAQQTYLTTAPSDPTTLLTLPEDYHVNFGGLKTITFQHGKRSVKVTIDELMDALEEKK